ncbi:MAG: shikimate kinase [Acholeplasmatales bacterium]|nr:shikimate kinase [Acholeplasmatales bacterium]
MRLYLIGMPGSGKSTLGKKLSKRLKYTFIDMDNYIEKKACMFVDEIFDKYGEEYFRALEKNTLNEFLDMNDVVIATGGGVIKDKNNKSLMDGKCIYLYVRPEALEKRLEQSKIVRPLLMEKSVYTLYDERKDLYEYFMDIKVDNENIDNSIENILEALK